MDLTANSMVEYREVYFDNKENFLGEETIFVNDCCVINTKTPNNCIILITGSAL